MRRRNIALLAAVVVIAGVAAAVTLPGVTGGNGDTARLISPGPRLVYGAPRSHVGLPSCSHLRSVSYLSATAASVVGGVVDLSGRIAYVNCIGGGKVSYAQETKSRILHLPSSVAVLRRTATGSISMTAGDLPLYLADPSRFAGAEPTKVFELRGRPRAISQLIEVTNP